MVRTAPRGVLFRVLAPLALGAVFCAASLRAQELPRPAGFVNDFAGVMNGSDARAVENIASALRQKTGAEIAVVTVKSFAPFASIDEFSLALAESWGIGKKGEDNGVLLVLAVAERKVKLEVGYGLEGAIPDSAAGRLLDTAVLPAFRQGDFSGGLAAGTRAVAALIAKEKGIAPGEFDFAAPGNADAPEESAGYSPLFSLLALLFLGIPGFFFLFALPARSGRGSRNIWSGFGGGAFGSSRGGFGGFRGFGGGGFGGGGASRGF